MIVEVDMMCGFSGQPFNVQTITDCLAQFGIKKGQVQKAVDALSAEGGSIICKVGWSGRSAAG